MDYEKFLAIAGVPADLHDSAISSLMKAEQRAKGLTLAKWKVRLFKAKKISELLSWEDERLIDKHQELAAWDIAPMLNITAHGDNVPWVRTNAGDLPMASRWLNPDPTSAEYQFAVSENYWKKGTHPRSKESRFAWYRRNAGEYNAWEHGEPVSIDMPQKKWEGTEDGTVVKVQHCGDVWFMCATYKKFKFLTVTTRIGFEIDNVFEVKINEETKLEEKTQLWYPIPNYELRAPVTWSTLPGKG